MSVRIQCASCKAMLRRGDKPSSREFQCPKCKAYLNESSFDPSRSILARDTKSSIVQSVPNRVDSQSTANAIPAQKTTAARSRIRFVPLLVAYTLGFVSAVCVIGTLVLFEFFPGMSSQLAITGAKNDWVELPTVRKNQNMADMFGFGSPRIDSVSWHYSGRIQGNVSLRGFELHIDINNPTTNAIQALEFYVKLQRGNRTVAEKTVQAGGEIAGGIEPRSNESLSIFIPKIVLKLDDYKDLPDDQELHVALKSIRYHGGIETIVGEPLIFVVAQVSNPAQRKLNPKNFRNPVEEWLNDMVIEGKNINP